MDIPLAVVAQALDYLDAHADAMRCERVCRGWRDVLLGRADTPRVARAAPLCEYWARAALRALCDRGTLICPEMPLAVGLLRDCLLKTPPSSDTAEPWRRWLVAVYAAPEQVTLRRLLPCLGAWLKCCALRPGPLSGMGAPRVGTAGQPSAVRAALRVTSVQADYALTRYEAPYCRALAAFAAHFIACAARAHPGARPRGAGRRVLWRVVYVGNAAVANAYASEFRSYLRRLLMPTGVSVVTLVNGSLVPPPAPRYWLDAFAMRHPPVFCATAGITMARVYTGNPMVQMYAAASLEALLDSTLLRDGVPLDVLLTDGVTLPADVLAVLVAPHTLVRATRLMSRPV